MNANPGDLVVCVDASRPDCPGFLKEGRVYTVASLGELGGYFLLEVEPPHWAFGGFAARRFRKLNDGGQNAKLIERIRNCKPAKAPALTPSGDN